MIKFMAVVVDFLGRLGNNLFQYSLGRIIAETLGYRLTLARSQPDNFMIKTNFEGYVDKLFPSAISVLGRSFERPTELYGTPGKRQQIDLGYIINNHADRRIVLHGYFQRFEYYRSYKAEMKQWFHCDPQKMLVNVSADDVLLNIRRGNEFDNWTLPLTYYDEALQRIGNFDRVYVLGTGIDASVKSYLAKYEPIYLDGTIDEHFRSFLNFNKIILSNSTFAWWAGFLSEATQLYAARSTDNLIYAFTGWADVDLHMQEPRYNEISVCSIQIDNASFNTSTETLYLNLCDGTSLFIKSKNIDPRKLNGIVGEGGLTIPEFQKRLNETHS
jgi:hypothetical protein